MIASLFGQLGTRIFGGLSIALLLFVGVQTMRLSACERARAKVDMQLSDANATIRQFQATGERIEADRAQSVGEGAKQQQAIREVVRTIEVPTPVEGCETPVDVMEALK